MAETSSGILDDIQNEIGSFVNDPGKKIETLKEQWIIGKYQFKLLDSFTDMIASFIDSHYLKKK